MVELKTMTLGNVLRTLAESIPRPHFTKRKTTSLEEYFSEHKLQRGEIGKFEHYIPIYERYFSPYRGKPITLLEIGVFRGGSLGMWKSYFGRDSRIYGMDIDPRCTKYASENVKIFIGDQQDRLFLRQCLQEMPRPDIVIDDGGHFSAQQIA